MPTYYVVRWTYDIVIYRCDVRHRTSGTYDIVPLRHRTSLRTMSYARCCTSGRTMSEPTTSDGTVRPTYDVVGSDNILRRTYYVVGSRSYTTSYVGPAHRMQHRIRYRMRCSGCFCMGGPDSHAHPRWDCILQTSVFIAVHSPQLRQGRGPQAPPQPPMQDAQHLPQEAAQQPLSSVPRRGSVAGSRWHWLLEDLCAQYPLFTVADLSC